MLLQKLYSIPLLYMHCKHTIGHYRKCCSSWIIMKSAVEGLTIPKKKQKKTLWCNETDRLSPWLLSLSFPRLPQSHNIICSHLTSLSPPSTPLLLLLPGFVFPFLLSLCCLSQYTAARLMSPISWDPVSCVRSALLQRMLWNPPRATGLVLSPLCTAYMCVSLTVVFIYYNCPPTYLAKFKCSNIMISQGCGTVHLWLSVIHVIMPVLQSNVKSGHILFL